MSDQHTWEHGADCHASGAVPRTHYIVKGARTLQLCTHCLHDHPPTLVERGWDVVVIEPAKPAVKQGVTHGRG